MLSLSQHLYRSSNPFGWICYCSKDAARCIRCFHYIKSSYFRRFQR